MIDTHAHLDLYSTAQDQTIAGSLAKLSHIITIGINEPTSKNAVQIADKYKQIKASVGIHPEEVSVNTKKQNIEEMVGEIEKLANRHRNEIVAIGEIGLDYHIADIDVAAKKRQQELFRKQIKLAVKLNLPVIIHSRDAFVDTCNILFAEDIPHRGIWHSFTGNISQANQIIDQGFLLGVNGIVTFPSAKELQTAIKKIDIKKLVLETDAPFLAPQKYRGKTNYPFMVEEVAAKVASLKNLSVADIIAATDINANQIFSLK